MSKSSGPTSNGGRKYANARPSAGGASGPGAFLTIPPESVAQCIHAVLSNGDALLVGTTRDGGALLIQIFYGDEVEKLYAHDAGELLALLDGVRDVALTQLGGSSP